jgi:hypothetical protein
VAAPTPVPPQFWAQIDADASLRLHRTSGVLSYRRDEKFRGSILGIVTWFVVLAELILVIRQRIRGSLEGDIAEVHWVF